jgi:hypothetical protein
MIPRQSTHAWCDTKLYFENNDAINEPFPIEDEEPDNPDNGYQV